MRQTIAVLAIAGLVGACATTETTDTSVPPTSSSTSSSSTTTITVDTTVAPPATPPPPTTATPTTAAPTTTTTVLAPPSFTFEHGTVEGPETLAVTLGEEAVFAVISDVVDEVHVHGYDLHFDLEPGVTTEVRFMADVPGVFEVEIESSHTALVDLVVEP